MYIHVNRYIYMYIHQYIHTVELLITDLPRSGQSLYNGQTPWQGLKLSIEQYITNLRGADNLHIPDNGQVSWSERPQC